MAFMDRLLGLTPGLVASSARFGRKTNALLRPLSQANLFASDEYEPFNAVAHDLQTNSLLEFFFTHCLTKLL